jgi:hypothetical protein
VAALDPCEAFFDLLAGRLRSRRFIGTLFEVILTSWVILPHWQTTGAVKGRSATPHFSKRR